MIVNSVSGQNFAGKRDNINAFINLDDNALSQIAKYKASRNIDEGKHKRASRALTAALPVSIGLSAAVASKKPLQSFAIAAGSITAFLLGIDAAYAIGNKIRSKNESVANFAEKHPITSFTAAILGSMAIGEIFSSGALFGAVKLKDSKAYASLKGKLGGLAAKVSQTKVAAQAKNLASKGSKLLAKTPASLKSIGKKAAVWSPWIVIGATILETIGYRNKVNYEYSKQYNSLKDAQMNILKSYKAELEAQNNLLKANS